MKHHSDSGHKNGDDNAIHTSKYFCTTRSALKRKKASEDESTQVQQISNEPCKTANDRESSKRKRKAGTQITAVELENRVVIQKLPSYGLERLLDPFFDVPCENLAQNLLGKVLVRRLVDGTILKGRIVETECYLGGIDKASHSYNGKITPRNKPMFMKPGTVYVYLTYGMYHCFNISSRGDGAAVLLRAIEPLEGMEYMQQQRNAARKGIKKKETSSNGDEPTKSKRNVMKDHTLCNGPAKLCISFNINIRDCNMQDLCLWDGMWIEVIKDRNCTPPEGHRIITSTRIGIDSVGAEWASKPLRFYLFGSTSVSRVDKAREKGLQV